MRKIIPLLVLLYLGCKPVQKETFDIVITNGNVIDLETGETTVRTIFVSDGRIQKITFQNDSTGYRAKEKIDATGKFMLPGFWDNHVHFRGGDTLVAANKNFLKLFIANGITTVRDAGGDLTSTVMDWKKQIAKGNLIGPTIFTSGPKIDGPGATWAGSLEVENEKDINNALDMLQRIPTDFVKLYESTLSGENYLKTIAEAERRGLLTSGHMPFTVTLDETIDAGIDGIEHLYYILKGCSSEELRITQQLIHKEIGFWDAMPALITSYEAATAQKTFARLKEKNVYVVPTLHIGGVLSHLDEKDHSQDDYLNYMDSGIIKTYQGRINSALGASEKARKNRKELDAFFGVLTKTLSDAGVPLMAGSDSGAFNSFIYPGISLHKEMEAMVNTGMSPLTALRTSAYNGAKFLKKDADYGKIAVGTIADLVILEANPVLDIKNTRKINSVLKGTTYFNKKELGELLRSVEVEYVVKRQP